MAYLRDNGLRILRWFESNSLLQLNNSNQISQETVSISPEMYTVHGNLGKSRRAVEIARRDIVYSANATGTVTKAKELLPAAR